MSIENRKFIRFALDVPVTVADEKGEKIKIMIKQISIGGCLIDLDDAASAKITGEEIRLEFTLPNSNKLPLMGTPLYMDNNKWTGIKFSEITQFEQELIADIIAEILEQEGLPLNVNPFRQPPSFIDKDGTTVETMPKVLSKQLQEIAAN